MSLLSAAATLRKTFVTRQVTKVDRPIDSMNVRFGSSGRVRNAMNEFKKREAMQRMRNIERRMNHTTLSEEQRAASTEARAERARKHAAWLEVQKKRKEARLAAEGVQSWELERAKLKEERKKKRTERRKEAIAIIRAANERIAELRAAQHAQAL